MVIMVSNGNFSFFFFFIFNFITINNLLSQQGESRGQMSYSLRIPRVIRAKQWTPARWYSPLPKSRTRGRYTVGGNYGNTNAYNGSGNGNNFGYGYGSGGNNSYVDIAIPSLFTHPTLVLERQIEFMNVAFGFEQRNNYALYTPQGQPVGSMIERDTGIISTVLRQVYRLHRPFHVDVFDTQGQLVLTIKRNFSIINSHIKAVLPVRGEVDLVKGEVLGESVQRWHLWRRRYDLFTNESVTNSKGEAEDKFAQFGEIDSPFLAFGFPVRGEDGQFVGSIDRNWVGLAREMFTDTGVYVVRMGNFDDVESVDDGRVYGDGQMLNWRQRAVMLANAVSVDFDYFSRHSGNGGHVGFYE